MDTDLVLAAGLEHNFKEGVTSVRVKHTVMRDRMLGFGMIF